METTTEVVLLCFPFSTHIQFIFHFLLFFRRFFLSFIASLRQKREREEKTSHERKIKYIFFFTLLQGLKLVGIVRRSKVSTHKYKTLSWWRLNGSMIMSFLAQSALLNFAVLFSLSFFYLSSLTLSFLFFFSSFFLFSFFNSIICVVDVRSTKSWSPSRWIIKCQFRHLSTPFRHISAAFIFSKLFLAHETHAHSLARSRSESIPISVVGAEQIYITKNFHSVKAFKLEKFSISRRPM